MLKKLMGNKLGMTQIFDANRKSIPVTVINISNWFITQIKTEEKDGYCALQVGFLKKKYKDEGFSSDWLSKKKKNFSALREIPIDAEKLADVKIGQCLSVDNIGFGEGDFVNVTGTSIGRGFQGVVKRWGFAGGPSGHGSRFHRTPGSIGNMCSQGKVVKGKKLPGHLGVQRTTVKALKVIRVDKDSECLYITGCVPGKKNSLLEISKQG
jgi:large subunit ribosomal protein L3